MIVGFEGLCEEFYSERGRGSIPPGRYFRRLFTGYFEGIDSQRGIAWRCDDSLSLKVFLNLEPFDEAPDHSRGPSRRSVRSPQPR